MKIILKPLVVSSLLLSSLSAVSYEATQEASTPKDSKSIVDFRFDFDFSNLQGSTEDFAQDELSIAANIESYTAEDIERSQAQDLYDFLNHNSSVNVLPSYGSKASQLLDLGGFGQANGYQNVVIKVNGRRMNNIDGVPQLLSSISLDSIDKIEILKGAGSVVNGDGATGGVINIKLKKNTDLGYKIYTGSFDTDYVQVRAGYSSEKLFLLAMSDYHKTEGNRIYDASKNENNAEEIRNSSLSLSYDANEKTEFFLNFNHSNSDVRYSGALTLDEYKSNPNQATTIGWTTHQRFQTDAYGAGLNVKISKNLALKSNITYEKKYSEYVGSTQFSYDYIPFDLSLKFAAKNFELKTGIDGFTGERKREGSDITSKDNLAGFVSYSYTHAKKHGYRLGYRLENVAYNYAPISGTSLNENHDLEAFEAGYAYKLTKNKSFYLNFNHAFLAPNIDAFFSGGAFNAFIEPQKVETTTLGYKHLTKKYTFKTSLFYSRLHNEIYFDKTIGAWGTNSNIDESQKVGFNLYSKYKYTDNIATSINYNYVNASILTEDANTSYAGKQLPGTPPHSVTVAIDYKFAKKAKINISQNYRSEAYASNDFSNTFNQKQEAYISTDLAFSYNHSKQLKFFTKVQNLFGEDNGIWIKDDNIYPINFETNVQVGLKGSF